MCTSNSTHLTPVSKRPCLSLPECPPPPKAQKPTVMFRRTGFPSLPLSDDSKMTKKCEVGIIYECAKAERTNPSAKDIAIILRKTRGRDEDVVMTSARMKCSKAA